MELAAERTIDVGGVQRVTLRIPARPDYVALSRLVIAAIDEWSDLTPEHVADLKVAVSEACASFIPASPQPGDCIEVLFEVHPDRWVVTVVAPWPAQGESGVTPLGDVPDLPAVSGLRDADEPFELDDETLGLAIIEALVDSVVYEPRDGGQALVMVKYLP